MDPHEPPPHQSSMEVEDTSNIEAKDIVNSILVSVIESAMTRKRKSKAPLMTDVPKSKFTRHSDSASHLSEGNVKIRQIGDCVLVPIEKFDGDKLPTKSEILCRIFYLRDKSHSRPMKAIAEDIFLEVEQLYSKAFALSPSTKKKQNCVSIFTKLHGDYDKVLKHKGKLTPKDLEFIRDIDQLCDIAPIDTENQINNDRLRPQFKKNEDIKFLKDQRSTRIMVMEKLDSHYAKKVDAKLARNSRYLTKDSTAEIVSTTSQSPDKSSDSDEVDTIDKGLM